MAYPVVIYTNLFTLPNKQIANNRYIDMYYVWLYNIIKYAKLSPQDYCITLVDENTLKYIEKSQIYQLFRTLIPNFRIVQYKQPETIKEGILERYNIYKILEITSNIEYLNPLYIHLDIDVLAINDIRMLFTADNTPLHKTQIYIKPEGESILDGLYYGELITDEEKELLKNKNLTYIPGLSAGIYGWRNSKHIDTFFNYILEKASTCTKELYTIEQPFFNAAIFNYMFREIGIFNFIILDTKKIGHNTIGAHNNPDSVLINFCGIPGDDMFHWDKILLQLLLQSLTPS